MEVVKNRSPRPSLPLYSPELIDEGPRGSILLIAGTGNIRRSNGGPQKPFSWLSEGVRGVFTTDTEAGEMICIPHLHILGATPMSSW
jgi:hypothetical protein